MTCSMKADKPVKDGTYIVLNGELVNYGEKWSYGYIVATENLVTDYGYVTVNELTAMGGKLGVWTDPATDIVYIDRWEHISDRVSAIQRGKDRGELAIWDLYENKAIDL